MKSILFFLMMSRILCPSTKLHSPPNFSNFKLNPTSFKMLEKLNVKVGPQFYRYGTNAIDNIPKLITEYNAKNILILHGTVSWKKAKPYFSSILNDVGFNSIW